MQIQFIIKYLFEVGQFDDKYLSQNDINFKLAFE